MAIRGHGVDGTLNNAKGEQSVNDSIRAQTLDG